MSHSGDKSSKQAPRITGRPEPNTSGTRPRETTAAASPDSGVRESAAQDPLLAPTTTAAWKVAVGWTLVFVLFVVPPLASAACIIWYSRQVSAEMQAMKSEVATIKNEIFAYVKKSSDKIDALDKLADEQKTVPDPITELRKDLPDLVVNKLEAPGNKLVRINDLKPEATHLSDIRTDLKAIPRDPPATAEAIAKEVAKLPGQQKAPVAQPANDPNALQQQLASLKTIWIEPIRTSLSDQTASNQQLAKKVEKLIVQATVSHSEQETCIVICRGGDPSAAILKPQLKDVVTQLSSHRFRVGIVEAFPGKVEPDALKKLNLLATPEDLATGKPLDIWNSTNSDLLDAVHGDDLPNSVKQEMNGWHAPDSQTIPPKACVLLVGEKTLPPSPEKRFEWNDFAVVHVVMVVSKTSYDALYNTDSPPESHAAAAAIDKWSRFCNFKDGALHVVEAPAANTAGGNDAPSLRHVRRALHWATAAIPE